MHTIQLQNKEETVRVQGESLRVAEARIERLAARARMLRQRLAACACASAPAPASASASAAGSLRFVGCFTDTQRCSVPAKRISTLRYVQRVALCSVPIRRI
ncbi:hypothetical protein ACJJTC_018929 [Scirpophaga incertulas]